MDIPTPKDLAAALSRSDNMGYLNLLSQCVDELKANWQGDSHELIIHYETNRCPFSTRVINKVRTEMAKAGWLIKFHTCQRDGDWISIKAIE